MDEKLEIRFRKRQNATINAKIFIFCIFFEKGSEKFILCRLLDRI